MSVIYKKLLLCILISIATFQVSAQWKAIDTDAKGGLRCVFFPTDSVGYAVGDSGTVLKTTNQGESWELIEIQTKLNLYSLYFTSKDTGIVATDSSIIFRTTDGGNSWNLIKINHLKRAIKKVQFVTPEIGFLCGQYLGGIYKTTDGGVTWDSLQNRGAYSLHFPSRDTGYAVFLFTVIKTTNQGVTWDTAARAFGSPADQHPLMGTLETCFFISNSIGFVSGWYDGNFSKTTDGGENWESLAKYFYRDIFFPNPQTGYAVGGNSSIRKTFDSGNTWQGKRIEEVGINLGLNSVYFIDDEIGFTVGFRSTKIYKTTTGGGFENTGLEEPQTEHSISVKVFPNPFEETIHITTSNLENNITVKLYNINGQEVSCETERTMNHITIKTGKQTPGMYLSCFKK